MDPEQVVREFFRLLALPDTKAAVTLLDEEVVWRNTGLPTIKGRRVGGMLLDAEARGLTVDITIHHAAATGDVVYPTELTARLPEAVRALRDGWDAAEPAQID